MYFFLAISFFPPKLVYHISTNFASGTTPGGKTSVGQGNWARVPWLSIFDNRITTSAQEGIYIVYLVSDDGKRLYLTLMQGASKLMNSLGPAKAKEELIKRGDVIRQSLDAKGFVADYNIQSGNVAYEKGCIFYKEYTAASLPNNKELEDDLKRMIEIYQNYHDEILNKRIEKPMPPEDQEPFEINILDINIADEIFRISDYIASSGFTFEKGTIENFYLSLKTKPFVILAGISGTGKTRLVKLFAEAIGATTENGRYAMVPVRPDWSDPSDLIGHVDLNGNFVEGAITDFLYRATHDITKPYFLCLDEMNLARVEYYFSDFLSVIETRTIHGDTIQTVPLLNAHSFGQDEQARAKYGDLQIPENVYIIGTVNMDETTFPFSRKVLDRASTIELSYVNLELIGHSQEIQQANILDNQFLKSDFLLLNDCEEYESTTLEVISFLNQLNDVLRLGSAQIGYRVRDEVSFYMIYNQMYELLELREAQDNIVLQKILPRIQGSSETVRTMLVELFKLCINDKRDDYQPDDNAVYLAMQGKLKNTTLPIFWPRSAEKIAFMMRRLEEDGFTSYWL